MKISATTLKATCLALIDQVHKTGEHILISKRGKVLAKLVPEWEDSDQKPWLKLKGKGRFSSNPFQPVLTKKELKKLGS